MKIRIYTDGACSGNPGPGGWAAILNVHECGIKISGNERHTTNNRMELMAVIKALDFVVLNESGILKEYDKYEVYSDSAYVINAVTKGWLERWKQNGWKTKSGDDIKNVELWKELVVLLEKLDVSFIKVKGHDGNTFNELVDKMAKEASLK